MTAETIRREVPLIPKKSPALPETLSEEIPRLINSCLLLHEICPSLQNRVLFLLKINPILLDFSVKCSLRNPQFLRCHFSFSVILLQGLPDKFNLLISKG